MTRTTTASRKTTSARKTSSTSAAMKKVASTPATAKEIAAALKTADKAIATQPARATRELTPKQTERAFLLGKWISADRWRISSRVVAGKTAKSTLDAMLARIVANVDERNGIRVGK